MTSRDAPTFPLDTAPWIPVLDDRGRPRLVSVSDIFRQARSIRAIITETATTNAAILGFLLAIMMRATHQERSEDAASDAWGQWWNDWVSVEEPVQAYLKKWTDRLDLLHPTEPIYQVAGLTTDSGNASGLNKLVPDGKAFRSTRSGTNPLTMAEAAQLLITCHAFDPAGIKTGAADDLHAKAGKGYSLGPPAWAGNVGMIILEGNDLADTLLLNYPLGLAYTGSDSAVWERPAQTGARDSHTQPTGPADLRTWQSRRIRLHLDADHTAVTDVQISNGDGLIPENRQHLELMSAWRHIPAKATKPAKYVPVTHPPGRALWRGLEPLLAQTRTNIPPATIRWMASMRNDGHLPDSYPVQVRTVGVSYDPKNSVVETVVADSLNLHTITITDPTLSQLTLDQAHIADHGCIDALTGLAYGLAKATGSDPATARQKASAAGYAALDQPYQRWADGLLDPERRHIYESAWHQTARQICTDVGTNLCKTAGRAGLIGRTINDTYYSTAHAWSNFLRRLTKETPHAHPPTPTTTQEVSQ